MADDKSSKLQESGLVDWSVFSELVAMDEDEEGFSKSLFQTFVDQVIETFQEIDTNLKKKNLDKLSALGHYLKGSAAALGLNTIYSQCERIQNYGHKMNFDNFDLASKVKLSSPQSPNETADSSDSSDDVPNDKDSIPDEGSDDFWIALIEDALENARDGFEKSRVALNEYFDDEL
jgi:osomolarity two-component system phosphorelay intermediate protein YPD1